MRVAVRVWPCTPSTNVRQRLGSLRRILNPNPNPRSHPSLPFGINRRGNVVRDPESATSPATVASRQISNAHHNQRLP